MKSEIIAVGTEILLGQIVNTNATFLSQQLAEVGFDVYYQSVVGDNERRILDVLRLAEKRSDLVILCGGLGPTEDDLTKDAVAKYLNLSLIEYEPAVEKLEDYSKRTGKELTKNNFRQALIVETSQAVENPNGLAVGCLVEKEGTHYLLLPGPPNELHKMFCEEAIPLLKKMVPETSIIDSRVLRFYGIGESKLATELAEIIAMQTNPTVAPYAKQDEVTLRLTAKGADQESVEEKLNELEEVILEKTYKYFYGYGDDNSLEKVVVQLLKEKGKTVTGAESLTGGLFQSKLTEIEGASEVFVGGFVTYAPYAKAELLDIPVPLIEEFGVVSSECAEAMAERSREILNTDFSVSFTGVAGPDSLEGNLPGTVWIGLAEKGKEPISRLYKFSRPRNFVRHSAVMAGLDLLRQELLKN